MLVAQSAIPAQSEAASQLVTIGRLIRSGQSRNGTPRFALLGEDGAVTAYVVPSSGLNLGTHINQQVAVTARRATRGSDGFVYLLAQRVRPMDQATAVAPPPGVLPMPMPTPIASGAALEPSLVSAPPSDLNEPRILPEVDALPLAATPAPQPGAAIAGAASVGSEQAAALDLEAAFWDELGSRQTVASPASHQVMDEPIAPPVQMAPSGQVMPGASPIAQSQMMMPGEVISAEPYAMGGGSSMFPDAGISGLGGCSDPNCNSCQFNFCNSGPCGPMGLWWLQGDYLLWWSKSMYVPPLVTTATGNPLAQDAGVLGRPTTEILYGDESILKDSRSGGRFRLGRWLDMCHARGFEVDFAFLESETETFSRSSTGNPILARPFFNTQLNAQDAELVAYPGVVSGSVHVETTSDFYTIAPRFRWNLRCQNFLPHAANGCGACNGCGDLMCTPAGSYRVDFTLGYRHMSLEEGLMMRERLLSNATASPAAFDLHDSFLTENEFHGVELGLVWEYYRGPWSLEFLSRFALGNNSRLAAINGSTSSTVQGAGFTDVGGLLALQSNIGTYEDDAFAVIPELGVNLGYQIAPSLRFIVGYTFIYWGEVVRPGDLIDLNINPNLLPPVITTDGANAPSFAWNDSNYWVQGVNFGLDWRW